MNVACVVSVQSMRKEGCVSKMNSKSSLSWHGDYSQVYNTAVTAVCRHVCDVCAGLSLLMNQLCTAIYIETEGSESMQQCCNPLCTCVYGHLIMTSYTRDAGGCSQTERSFSWAWIARVS